MADRDHLVRLAASGRRLVTPELISGALAAQPKSAWIDHVEPLAGGLELDLTEFDQAVASTIAETEPHASALDRLAAPRIHRALPLDRRSASDPGIWRYLAVVRHPAFIRHRWENPLRDRFWRAGLRPDSNSFSRLWWIAELTAVDGDYSLTERALATQSIAIGVFVRHFAAYPPATRACVEVLHDQPGAIVEQVLRRFNAYLSGVVLESLDAATLREQLFALVDVAWDERA